MAELHRLYHAVDDQGGAESGSQAQKQHLATVVTPQGLHGGVVHDFDGTTEGLRKIEPDPATSQVDGFRRRPSAQNRAGVTDRDRIICPIRGKFFTPDTMRLGVRAGPDRNDRLSVSPLTRIFTEVPPTSMTSTLLTKG